MDKNTVTGFVLIGAVLLGFSYLNQPSQEQIEAQMKQDSLRIEKIKADSVAAVKAREINAELARVNDSIRRNDSTTLFFRHLTGEARTVTLRNKNVEVNLSTLGGTPCGVKLLGGFQNYRKETVTLLTKSQMALELRSEKNERIELSRLYFEPVAQSDSSVTMRLYPDADETRHLDLTYTLRGDSYMTDVRLQAHQMAQYLSTSDKSLYIDWQDSCLQQEKGYDFENRYATLTYKEKDDDTDELSQTGSDSKDYESGDPALEWVAFKNQFFSAVLIGHNDFSSYTLQSAMQTKESGILKNYAASLKTKFDPTGRDITTMQFYTGPNNYHLLQEHNELSLSDKDLELENLVNLGWPLFRWINRFFIIYLFDWLTSWGLPMGIVLLLLTILIKIVVYPPTRKSFLSSARMRVLKPKVDELSRKYPNQEDAMKKQQEMMALYKEYGVSPMGGCLPMLIQMPLWIALFNFVPNAIELRGQSFLWADDLSAYDDVINWGFHIPLLGDHLSIFCLLFCVTNIINTVISMRQQKNQMSSEQASQMKMMQYMMYFMPVMFFFMFNDYASGLCYYYFLSGLTSILVMWYLRKTTDDKKLLAQLEAYREAHKNDPKKLTGLAARLEALQKQQEMMRQQQNYKKK